MCGGEMIPKVALFTLMVGTLWGQQAQIPDSGVSGYDMNEAYCGGKHNPCYREQTRLHPSAGWIEPMMPSLADELAAWIEQQHREWCRDWKHNNGSYMSVGCMDVNAVLTGDPRRHAVSTVLHKEKK